MTKGPDQLTDILLCTNILYVIWQDKYSNYTEKLYPHLETKVQSIVFIRKTAFLQELMDCSPS